MRSLVSLLLLLVIASVASAQADDPVKPNIAIVIFDGVQIIDFTGPYEVFGQYNRNDVYTVAATTEPITTTMGMVVVPAFAFEDAPAPDVLVVPGGTIEGVRDDPEFLDWLRGQSGQSEYTLSVCNGAFLLAEAGLLDGLRATTFYDLLDDLDAYPEITVVDDQRFVDNGSVVTSAGLSSGLDAALHVQARLHGQAWANVIALNLEYDWRPDTDYSRPQFADLNQPNAIYALVWPHGELRTYEGDREAWGQSWRIESDETVDVLDARLGEGLDDEGWVREASEGGRSTWSFTGRDGLPWTGEASVEPSPEAPGYYDVTIRVSSGAPSGS